MGMFDYVKYKANCWKCGAEMSGFQSKDGDCLMQELKPEQVKNFYDICPKCEAWNEYDVISKEVEIIFNEKESKSRTEN